MIGVDGIAIAPGRFSHVRPLGLPLRQYRGCLGLVCSNSGDLLPRIRGVHRRLTRSPFHCMQKMTPTVLQTARSLSGFLESPGVMVRRESEPPEDQGGFEPLAQGRIQLETEGADVFYRAITIELINGFTELLVRTIP